MYDVVIVGAGPGGIFTAYELLEKRPDLSETYQRAIRQYIEPYRLLNTKLSIVQPEYGTDFY